MNELTGTLESPFGFEIAKDSEGRISLTDLWKAAGSSENNRPAHWMQIDETKGFIKAVERLFKYTPDVHLKSDKSKGGLRPLLKTTRGKYGGTFAHEQIALEYAQYLDPALGVYVNNLFLNPDAAVNHHVNFWKAKGKDDNWITERMGGILQRKKFTGILKEHNVKGIGYADCTNAIYKHLWGGGADLVRMKKQLPEGTNTREHMTAAELAAVRLSELLAEETIEKVYADGNEQCRFICEKSSKSVARSIIEMRTYQNQNSRQLK